MNPRRLVLQAALLAGMGALGGGCFDEPTARDLWPPEVFTDTFVENEPQAFAGSKLFSLETDTQDKVVGSSSMKVSVPTPSDPEGNYVGWAFVANRARNLSAYDAVTFWAKASIDAEVGVIGIGNDNTGTSQFTTFWSNVPVTTQWKKYVLPTPLPDKLTAEKGLFYFSAGAQDGNAYTLWFDDIRFERLGASVIGPPRPAFKTESVRKEVGDTFQASDVTVTWTIDGADQTIEAALPYFTWASSDPSVVSVNAAGNLRAEVQGTATVTAKLGEVDVAGTLTVEVASAAVPATPAPTPAHAPGDVISIWSSAYANVAVDTFRTDWSSAGPVTDVQVGSTMVKRYSSLNFVGIEFTSPVIDASVMSFFHLDLWTPDSSLFKVKLVDFGADGAFGGGDDSEHELTFDASSSPALATNSWVSLDIPFASFTGLTNRAHLAQLILSGSNSIVFVDNIYFHK